ncbi:MAG: nitrate/nitrite transporter NrtS [Pseudorhodoplanes sp.]|uniref:nitrate/nitrite transporter NrtS n=1 Tax=Pseudorhodoplanes sp. TaxID=1934341 RepID=UPI003D0C597E
MSKIVTCFRCAISDGIPLRSFYVAVVVGTILNLINQGDALLGYADVSWVKLLMTYCVPYLVATYGAVSYKLRSWPGSDGSGKPE